MNRIEPWDWPDTVVPRYDEYAEIPEPTTANLRFLAKKHNELVDEIEKLTSSKQNV